MTWSYMRWRQDHAIWIRCEFCDFCNIEAVHLGNGVRVRSRLDDEGTVWVSFYCPLYHSLEPRRAGFPHDEGWYSQRLKQEDIVEQENISPGQRYNDSVTRWVKENRHRFDDRMRLDGKEAEDHPCAPSETPPAA